MFSAHTLTDRDLSIVRMAYEYRGCTVDHIRARFFPTPGARTPCYRRVRYLLKEGYLAGTRLPAQSGQGSGRLFLTSGPKGRLVLAQMLDLPRSQLARTRMDSSIFVAHHLAICDARLALEIAAESSPLFELRDWVGDQELHQHPQRVKDPKTSEEISIVPDATFSLSLRNGNEEQAFRLEMDMATVAPKRMLEKLRAYLALRDTKPVLFVVPDAARQRAVVHWALSEAQDLGADPTIFWITTKSVLTPNTALSAPIWHIVGGPKAFALEEIVSELARPKKHPSFATAQGRGGDGGSLS